MKRKRRTTVDKATSRRSKVVDIAQAIITSWSEKGIINYTEKMANGASNLWGNTTYLVPLSLNSLPQTRPRSVQPFLQGASALQADRLTDRRRRRRMVYLVLQPEAGLT